MKLDARYIEKTRLVSVGFSGGRDSVALLHCLKSLGYNVQAAYVSHNIADQTHKWAHLADKEHWLNFCKEFCQTHSIPFINFNREVTKFGNNWEGAARLARHDCFRELDTPVILAHHLHDSLESLWIKVFRGASVESLSGMKSIVVIDGTTFIRPMLKVSREHINDYLTTNALPWVEDESNGFLEFDRNYVRSLISPHLLSRFSPKEFLRCLDQLKEAEQLLEYLASTDLLSVEESTDKWCLVKLKAMSDERLKNLLKSYLRKYKRQYTRGFLSHWVKMVKLGRPTSFEFRGFRYKFTSKHFMLESLHETDVPK